MTHNSDNSFFFCSASGCPLANKNKGRVLYEGGGGSSSSSSASPKYSSGFGSTKLASSSSSSSSYGQTDGMAGLDGVKSGSKKIKCADVMMDTSDGKVSCTQFSICPFLK